MGNPQVYNFDDLRVLAEIADKVVEFHCDLESKGLELTGVPAYNVVGEYRLGCIKFDGEFWSIDMSDYGESV